MAEAGEEVWKRQPCRGPEAEEHDRGDYQRDADESHRGLSLADGYGLPLGPRQRWDSGMVCIDTRHRVGLVGSRLRTAIRERPHYAHQGSPWDMAERDWE